MTGCKRNAEAFGISLIKTIQVYQITPVVTCDDIYVITSKRYNTYF